MSTFTIQQSPAPAEKFKIVSNDFLRGRLPVPLKALERVLLGYFLSLPDGWRMDRRQLDESVLEGRDAVSKALAGLESKRYLRRDRVRGKDGSWSWTWAVTLDPVAHPLAAPSPENQSMAPTSGNGVSPQVAPSTESPSTVNQSIKEEDGVQKTEEKTDGASAIGAAAGASAAAPAAAPRTPIQGNHLEGLGPKALTHKLTAVWSAVVLEHGGTLPAQDSSGWDHDGTRLERGKHPIGGTIKTWLKAHPRPGATQLDDALTKIRGHAQAWAQEHQRSAA